MVFVIFFFKFHKAIQHPKKKIIFQPLKYNSCFTKNPPLPHADFIKTLHLAFTCFESSHACRETLDFNGNGAFHAFQIHFPKRIPSKLTRIGMTDCLTTVTA